MAKTASSYKIQKRDDGRWSIRLQVNGKYVYIYGQTKSEVQSKLKAKLAELEQAKASQLNNFLNSKKMTVEQWARVCLETYSKVSGRESTYVSYLSIIENHLKPLGDYKLSEVTNAMVQEHLQREARGPGNENGLGEKSLTNVKAFLSLIFNQALRNGYILRNPVTGVKIPKAGKKETIALSVEQQHALLTAARNYLRPIMFAVVFACYTGCRKGEVMGLLWKDVDFDEGVIHISKQLHRSSSIIESGEKKSELKVSEPKTKSSVRNIYVPELCKGIQGVQREDAGMESRKQVHSFRG